MRQRPVYLPELALIGATRGMIGFGAALLIGDRLGRDRRNMLGKVLLILGALSTIPLALRVMGRGRLDHSAK